jgi:hypothetical protein
MIKAFNAYSMITSLFLHYPFNPSFIVTPPHTPPNAMRKVTEVEIHILYLLAALDPRGSEPK